MLRIVSERPLPERRGTRPKQLQTLIKLLNQLQLSISVRSLTIKKKMCPNGSLLNEGTFGNDAKHVSERGWLQRGAYDYGSL